MYNGARVQMDNCIIENNRAFTGPAVGATTVADNVKLVMRNCVVNNNTVVESPEKSEGDDPWLISVYPKYMEFNHVTIVNNIAWGSARRTAQSQRPHIVCSWQSVSCRHGDKILQQYIP